jgi:uncharacterized membrane protein YgcG
VPDFVPQTAPEGAILDLSGSLSDSSVRTLEQAASTLSYRPKVLILPKNYICSDAHQLALDVAKKWNTYADGKNLFMLVDIHGHKVRVIGSNELVKDGITSSYLTNDLVPRQFVPYMRHGDLASAIRLTLLEVDHKAARTESSLSAPPVSQEKQLPASGTVAPSAPASAQVADNTPAYLGYLFFGLMVAIVLAALASMRWSSRNDNINRLRRLKPQFDSLYQEANQLGQAADYLDPVANLQLSHDIADFFAKLATVQKAQSQVEEMATSFFNAPAAGEALRHCERYLQIMKGSADKLLKRVNEKTGAVTTFEPDAKIEDKPRPSISELQIGSASGLGHDGSTVISTKYRAPSWMQQPAYARRENSRGLEDMRYYLLASDPLTIAESRPFYGSSQSGQSQPRARGHSDGGGMWGSGSSSGGSYSDGGGSWGSSSSDSGSSSSGSDGGGSW